MECFTWSMQNLCMPTESIRIKKWTNLEYVKRISGLTISCSCPATSDSLQPHGLQPARLLCPWNSPGKKLDWAAISYSREYSWPRDRTCISCLGRILNHCATWEVELTIWWLSKQFLSAIFWRLAIYGRKTMLGTTVERKHIFLSTTLLIFLTMVTFSL